MPCNSDYLNASYRDKERLEKGIKEHKTQAEKGRGTIEADKLLTEVA